MVSNVKFVLKRTIVAYAKTIQGVKKEFKDEQEIMFGRFDDQVAAREPQKITRDYAIMMRKVKDSDRERNRVILRRDLDTGLLLP